MATTPSVKVIKSFAFKGGTRYFSNRYHFNGGTPADASHWHTLMDNIVTAEKAIFSSLATITECVGYNAGSDLPVASKTYSTSGTLSTGAGDAYCPGECVALLRWDTTARTSKNHPIYLFNYFHSVWNQTGAGAGNLLKAAQKSAISTYAGSWISGFSDGSITAVRAGPNGATATGSFVAEYITHRDFPYTTSA
jgi:hypothetical protein